MDRNFAIPQEARLFILACISASALEKYLLKSNVVVYILEKMRELRIETYEENCRRYLSEIEELCRDDRLMTYLRNAVFNTDLNRMYYQAFKNGMDYVVRGGSHYPNQLNEIPAAPAVLFVKGPLFFQSNNWQRNTITIVGTRKPSDYGKRIACVLGDEIARRGGVVVSGLAYGIDAEVQKAAVESGGRVIAVLASPLDRIYPSEHQTLFDAICRNGSAVSEHPPGSKLYRNYFPARNRIMSGLSQVTVVVESSQRSGTLITVEQALSQGREVWAVPGSIYSPQSKGVNKLIADGAMVLHDLDLFLQEMNRLEIFPKRSPDVLNAHIAATNIEGLAKEVLTLLIEGPLSAETMAEKINVSEELIFETLSELEAFVPIRVSNGEFILT